MEALAIVVIAGAGGAAGPAHEVRKQPAGDGGGPLPLQEGYCTSTFVV